MTVIEELSIEDSIVTDGEEGHSTYQEEPPTPRQVETMED